jgi:transcriptional regulator with XRE-family HTH domain
MNEELRDVIAARIDALGITQAEYARRLDISPAYLNQILKGKIDLPRGEIRRRLADDLGIPCSTCW